MFKMIHFIPLKNSLSLKIPENSTVRYGSSEYGNFKRKVKTIFYDS